LLEFFYSFYDRKPRDRDSPFLTRNKTLADERKNGSSKLVYNFKRAWDPNRVAVPLEGPTDSRGIVEFFVKVRLTCVEEKNFLVSC
jgi:hypothetical protein